MLPGSTSQLKGPGVLRYTQRERPEGCRWNGDQPVVTAGPAQCYRAPCPPQCIEVRTHSFPPLRCGSQPLQPCGHLPKSSLPPVKQRGFRSPALTAAHWAVCSEAWATVSFDHWLRESPDPHGRAALTQRQGALRRYLVRCSKRWVWPSTCMATCRRQTLTMW